MFSFEVDVSGSDILNADYTIVVAEKKNKNAIIGYKFSSRVVRVLSSRWGQGHYKYKKSVKAKALFRIRLYRIVVYYLFRRLAKTVSDKKIGVFACRDFAGHENDIQNTFKELLPKAGFEIKKLEFGKLSKESNADRYAYLLRKDRENKFKRLLIRIELDEFENFLK